MLDLTAEMFNDLRRGRIGRDSGKMEGKNNLVPFITIFFPERVLKKLDHKNILIFCFTCLSCIPSNNSMIAWQSSFSSFLISGVSLLPLFSSLLA